MSKASNDARSQAAVVEVEESPEKDSALPGKADSHRAGMPEIPQQCAVTESAEVEENTPVAEEKCGDAEQEPAKEKSSPVRKTSERQSLFHATEVVTRREQFEEARKLKRRGNPEEKDEEGEDEEEDEEKDAEEAAQSKKARAKAKAKEKKAQAKAKAKAKAKRDAKKKKKTVAEKKAEKKAAAEAKKQKKQEEATKKKEEKKAKAAAKKAAKTKKGKLAEDLAEEEEMKEVEVNEVGQSPAPTDAQPEIPAANASGGKKRPSTAGAPRKTRKVAKDGEHVKDNQTQDGQKDAPSEKAKSFARRNRPQGKEAGQRWDAVKKVFQEKVASSFDYPGKMEDRGLLGKFLLVGVMLSSGSSLILSIPRYGIVRARKMERH